MAINLSKGQKLDLSKDSSLTQVRLGLGWDPIKTKGHSPVLTLITSGALQPLKLVIPKPLARKLSQTANFETPQDRRNLAGLFCIRKKIGNTDVQR